ncbi:MAG: fasciclin domain-containing protein [Acidimicrobiales bacterium]
MKNTWLRALALLFAFTLIAAACGDDEEEQPVASGEAEEEGADEGEAAATADIVDTAVASGEFPTLVAALQAADLVDTLKGEGPFTVFAPTEEAFADALEALGVTAEELLADPNLASILTYHVVPGNVPAADVVGLDGQEVETVNGATVTIGVDGETVTVNDATVVQTDILASNGVIHVIDTVLLPPAG